MVTLHRRYPADDSYRALVLVNSKFKKRRFRDDPVVEPGLSSRTRLPIANRQVTYRKTTVSQNPDTGTGVI